jgi:uncharacterized phosphosugar-binding protein
MRSAAESYFDGAISLCRRVSETEKEHVEKAAELCAEALMKDGFLFTFGTGHSHLLAEEIFYRAGGLVRVCPIQDESLMLHLDASNSSQAERRSGLAESLLKSVPLLKRGGVLFVFSNSGCNTVAIEMALGAKKRGLPTICITSLCHSEAMTSRHPEGFKLKDVCDVVIDNGGCFGDAGLEVGDVRTGPTSTAVGAMLLQAVICRTIEICQEKGFAPEVFQSANTPGGDEINGAYIQKYRNQIRSL